MSQVSNFSGSIGLERGDNGYLGYGVRVKYPRQAGEGEIAAAEAGMSDIRLKRQ